MRDDGETLEVGDAFAVPVCKAGESLLVDAFDFVHVGVKVALSGSLALNDQVPRLFDV